jgi:hypothetical protein
VDIKVDAAATEKGAICGLLPSTWFATTTETPAQCAPTSAPDGDASPWLPVASILSEGECRVDVNVPGTSFHFPASFRTTR